MSTLKELYNAQFKLQITSANCDALAKLCRMIELRKDNPDAFNTSLLGVHRGYFYPVDQKYVFDLFGLDAHEFETKSHQLKTVHKERNVSSDPFNLLCTWIAHSIKNSKNINIKEKSETITTIMKLLLYKFFTSQVGKYFPYVVNKEIMQYTIDKLSMRYEIRQRDTHSWKLVIEKKAELIGSGESLHEPTLVKYTKDEDVLYWITDMNTRLNSTIKSIATEFYENVESNKKLGSYSISTTGHEGEAKLKDIEGSLGVTITNTQAIVLTASKFINRDYVKLVSKLIKLREDTIRDVLMGFNELAIKQHRGGEMDKEVVDKKTNEVFLEGYRLFVSKVIQKTFNHAVHSDVDVRNKLAVLQHTMNIYRNSRINDDDLLNIKSSALLHVTNLSHIKRSQSQISMGLGLIIYLLLTAMGSE